MICDRVSPSNVLTLSCERGLMTARLSAPTRSHNTRPGTSQPTDRATPVTAPLVSCSVVLAVQSSLACSDSAGAGQRLRPWHQPTSGGPPQARKPAPPPQPAEARDTAPVRRCRPPRGRSSHPRIVGVDLPIAAQPIAHASSLTSATTSTRWLSTPAVKRARAWRERGRERRPPTGHRM